MATVFQTTLGHTLKRTLSNIIDDETDGIAEKAFLHQWCDEPTMEDAYEDDLSIAGPGLLSEKTEGGELATVTMREEYVTRYLARTFGGKLLITQEAMEDNKYPASLKIARRLKRILWKTADVDATNMLVRGFNSTYVFGDGVSMFSASHTMANGGTFSNQMTVPMTPSRAAFIVADAACRKMPAHDGTPEGYNIMRVICPVDQRSVWIGITQSKMNPDNGNFNEINIAGPDYANIKVTAIPYWNNTTTNYAFRTDAEGGPQFRWRIKPESSSWTENAHQVMAYGVRARWARGLSDPRSVFGVNA